MQHSESIVPRPGLTSRVLRLLSEAPVGVLLGARQAGKTTLAQMVAEAWEDQGGGPVHWFDLELPTARSALSTAELTLAPLRGLVVLDEIQRMPDLFTLLRPLADRRERPARFLILGSASPELVRGVSETLAGRALFTAVPGFTVDELGAGQIEALWTRGSFPRSVLAPSEGASLRWREAFIATFLERDLPQLGIRVPAETLRRFWTMLAHYHGQVWNGAELAHSLDTSPKSAHHYRDILAGSFMVRVLPPWYENLKKRQVKSPKVYLRDSGLLHSLLAIPSLADLRAHPRYGASWEGFALEQVLAAADTRDAYFWSTQRGAELDLLLFAGGKRWGYEFKCADAPTMTKSMHIALQDLDLAALTVVYPGTARYRLHERVEVVPLAECLAEIIRSRPE
ncbi:MAG TPA: ATP-binding protein [bacterium]